MANRLAEKIVKAEIRKGKLVKSKDVLDALPEMLDAVYVDHDILHSSMEQCLATRNPLNKFLNLFGLQLINKKKTISRLADSKTDQWLTLDEDTFQSTLEKLTRQLYELESQAKKDYDSEKARADLLFGKYETLTKEYGQLKCSAETGERLIAERIQYILSLGGKDAADQEQLTELLKDLCIDVYWDCNDGPLPDAAMFTEYAIDQENMASIKPCLIRNGSVYVKGMRFVKK